MVQLLSSNDFYSSFCLYTSLHIRKSEDYRLPLWSVFAAGVSTALFVLVMTNDVHQAVFSFGEETFWSDDQYHYSWGYYIVMIWVAVCMCMTLLFMMRGAKVPHSKKRKLLPFVPIILIGIYAISYIAKIQALRINSRRYDISNLSACDDFHYVLYVEWSHSC